VGDGAYLERLEELGGTLADVYGIVAHQARPLRARFLSTTLGGLWNQYTPRRLTVPDRYRRRPVLAAWPTISIVTPALNAAEYVEATIRSVLAQEYPRLEYVVQDGGSTDETIEIVSRYGARLIVDSRPDSGQSQALNRGFQPATGEIMAYLNSDDLLLPGALHYVGWFLERHPNIDAVYGHRVLINGEGWETGRWVLPAHDDRVLSWADYVPQETLFWRRRIWEKAGGTFDETLQFAMDWELLLRFRDAGARFARVPRFLGAFRVHRGQKTSARMRQIGAREMARLRERVHGEAVSPAEIHRGIRGYLLWAALYQRLYKFGLVRY
jgi:glycosyltransferase involved in cell wall biosynthesis